MNLDNHPKRKERQLPAYLRWIAMTIAILGLVALLAYLTVKNQPVTPESLATVATSLPHRFGWGVNYGLSIPENSAKSVASLPQILRAVAAGEIKTLIVHGNLLIATKTDGTKISVHKESSISAVEALQILGAPPEALTKLPTVVEEQNGDFNLISVVVVLAFWALVAFFIFYHAPRPQSSSSRYSFGSMGRRNPRIIAGAAERPRSRVPSPK